MEVTKEKLKMFAVIFTVVLVGVGCFDLAFYIIYKDPLEMGSCDLCFELNPHLAECETWEPLNYSRLRYGE